MDLCNLYQLQASQSSPNSLRNPSISRYPGLHPIATKLDKFQQAYVKGLGKNQRTFLICT